MDRAASLISPGSKTLAGWWRQLATLKPRGLWTGYAYIHRIEAPVEVVRSQPIDPFVLLILQALDVAPGDEIDRWLGLPAPILAGILQGIQHDGLIDRADLNRWTISESGRMALKNCSVPIRLTERQRLPFIERLDNSGNRAEPPIFLPIAECPHTNWLVDEVHRFDPAVLHACVGQPCDWKEANGFPREIERLACDAVDAVWQHVIVDRAERVMLTLLTTADEFLGFGVKADGWQLNELAPVLRLPLAALRNMSDLVIEPAETAWRDAWRVWSKQRNLPANEVEACVVTFASPRVEILAPPRLVQRLQAANSDLLKGEGWLIVGEGFIRAAAPMVLKTGEGK
ncbi:MAG: hypothetical protein EXS16_05545 [Gemmataceae bacterium]|nr:hypothetical protein [Gemmataceae bacterium]